MQADIVVWSAMRQRLWPHYPLSELTDDATRMIAGDPTPYIAINTLLAEVDGKAIGFAEVSIRGNADGCETSPVGYLEGWYVEPQFRKQGIGGALVSAAEDWIVEQGCSEMGSDAYADNEMSRAAHRALGFHEKRAVVRFTKNLRPSD